MKIKLKRFKIVKSTNDIAIKLIKKNVTTPVLIGSLNRVMTKIVDHQKIVFMVSELLRV